MHHRSRQTLKRLLLSTFTGLFLFMQTAQAANYITFIHTDVLGSPVAITDQNGNIVSREHVSPYGGSLGKRSDDDSNPIGSSEHRIGYTGHVKDKDLGLTYMQARYYDPTIGRFMSTDPVGFRATNPALFNRYAYANNNPYKYVDPDGEYFELGIEAVSIGLGAKSLADNLAAGNYTSATVDGLGIVADFTGSLIPGVPGVVGIGLSVARASKALTPAQVARIAKGESPPNLSPEGARRTGAFKEAKRQSGIPSSQQPSNVGPNLDQRGNVQPGRLYEFEVPASGGGKKTVKIRDDADGHDFGPGDSQNRGSHFNDEAGGHFDY